MGLVWVLLGGFGWLLFALALRGWVLAERRHRSRMRDAGVALNHLTQGDRAFAEVVLTRLVSGR